ncbi:Mss4-like protein [Aspergillus floccosus]
MTVDPPSVKPVPSPMEGGCACGYLRYRLENSPLVVHCCHCTSCQRETGTAFALNAVIETSNVTTLPSAAATVPASPGDEAKPAGPSLFQPEEATTTEPKYILTPSESQRGQSIARCPKCYVAVWSNYPGAGPLFRFIRVGTLDEPWKVGPDVHIYTRSKRSFVQLGADVPQYEDYYPTRETVWSKESMERWKKAKAEGGTGGSLNLAERVEKSLRIS